MDSAKWNGSSFMECSSKTSNKVSDKIQIYSTYNENGQEFISILESIIKGLVLSGKIEMNMLEAKNQTDIKTKQEGMSNECF